MKGQHYDWFDRQWVPDAKKGKLRGTSLVMQEMHRDLLRALLPEIKWGRDPVARLYVCMLARTVCQADEELMKEFGEDFAEMGATHG